MDPGGKALGDSSVGLDVPTIKLPPLRTNSKGKMEKGGDDSWKLILALALTFIILVSG